MFSRVYSNLKLFLFWSKQNTKVFQWFVKSKSFSFMTKVSPNKKIKQELPNNSCYSLIITRIILIWWHHIRYIIWLYTLCFFICFLSQLIDIITQINAFECLVLSGIVRKRRQSSPHRKIACTFEGLNHVYTAQSFGQFN